MDHKKKKYHVRSRNRSRSKERCEMKEKRDRSHSKTRGSEEIDEKLKRLRKDKRREKEAISKKIKETETSEEKRIRRLEKKLKKAEKRKLEAESICTNETSYTNSNNPFNDPNLSSTFVWSKKLALEGYTNLSIDEFEKLNKERVRKNLAEVEELKRNREARIAAREDYEMIRRDEERRVDTNWNKTEEDFLLSQAKLRSRIRLKEGRGKPIDYIARYLMLSGGQLNESKEDEFELVSPFNYLKGLKTRELEDLLEDIKVYRRVEPAIDVSWWADFSTIILDEMRRIKDDISSRNARDSIHTSVRSDIAKLFKGKKYEQLTALDGQIRRKIQSGEQGTDIEYWENLLQHLHVYMAKSRISERHNENVRNKIKKIRDEQAMEIEKEDVKDIKPAFQNCMDSSSASTSKHKPLPVQLDELEAVDDELQEQKWRQLTDEEMELITLEMWEKGSYDPTLIDEKEAMPGIEILDENEDFLKRKGMMEKANRDADSESASSDLTQAERAMKAIARQGMTNDEVSFGVEEPIEAQTFLWSEKYRPRKPRYFNRVHTGFEWNKYNQTHYDMENPPPKIVQGYRFNIFYPDLLDMTETPTFSVTPCDDPDFAVLRFHAGPPYEDIAFKIVNREWEISHKHGYKCQFATGIFQLWFFFKRYRYRR